MISDFQPWERFLSHFFRNTDICSFIVAGPLSITKVAELSLPHTTNFWVLWRGKSAENSI